jgi:GNAT superfamily N-acetyltransferase
MLKGFTELRESGTVRISFGKAGYALVDPEKPLSGDSEKGIPSLPDASYLNFIYVRYKMRGKGIGERMLRSIKAKYPMLWGIACSREGKNLMLKCGVVCV